MEENKRTDSGYTGEYGNPVEHNDAPQVETENAAAYSETAQSASEQGASAQAEQSSTYSYSYKNGEGTSTHSGDYYGGGAAQPNNESAQQSGAGPQQMNGYGSQMNGGPQQMNGGPQMNFRQPNQKPPKVKKPKQPGSVSTGKKIAFCIACAVIFGVVSGICFQGVRYVTNRFLPTTTSSTTKLQSTTDGKSASTAQSTSSPSTTQTGTTDVSGIAEQTMPAIVAITSTSQGANYYDLFGQQYQGQDTTSAGSGFIVGQNDKELLIATNNHVIDGAKTISVQFIDEQIYEATVKGTDSSNDLAVIAVQTSKIKESTMNKIRVADLGDSSKIKVGEMAVAIGNALGYGQSVTVGYISAKDREISESESGSSSSSSSNTIKAIQTDAAINPGNSGGALINMQGQVIGINSAKIAASEVEGVGYAIPISVAKPIIEDLMNKENLKDSEKGYLGISGRTVSDEMAAYNMPNGVYVAEVSKNGAADKAGIQKGDIITSINNMEVRSIESLQEKANSYKKGTQVEIILQRSDSGTYKEKKVKVTLQGSSSLNGLSSGKSSNNDSQSGNSGNNSQNGNNGQNGSNGNSGQNGSNGNIGNNGNNSQNGNNGNNGNSGSDSGSGNDWFGFGDLFGN